MSRCLCWCCRLVVGIIITNFTLLYNTFNLFTIYLSILQCTNYNHIAIVFPPLPLLDTHNRLFCRPSAASNSVNPGLFSKWRPAKDIKYRRRTRVQISASEAFAKKIRYAFSWRTSVTLINYALVSSGNPVCTHPGEFTMAAAGRASGPAGLRPEWRHLLTYNKEICIIVHDYQVIQYSVTLQHFLY